MKTVRFRIWDGEKMHYPGTDWCDGGYMLNGEGSIMRYEPEAYEGDGHNISEFNDDDGFFAMLSTGLKDKDGKEIWEGDLVKLVAGQEWPEICEVVAKEGYYTLSNLNDSMSDYLWEYTALLEVVDNKYEYLKRLGINPLSHSSTTGGSSTLGVKS